MSEHGSERDDEIARLLSAAFDARARGAVGDHGAPPPPRYSDPLADQPTDASADPVAVTTVAPPRRGRIWAPLAAAAAVVAVVAGALVLTNHDDGRTQPVGAPAPSLPSASASASAGSTGAGAGGRPVKITTPNADGATYGVGMPVIVYFSKTITDGRAFQAGTSVTANDRPIETAWYFQYSRANHGPIEAQLRPRDYWPADSKIHVQFPETGTALGKGMRLSAKLSSLDFRTGPSQIATVDNVQHRLTLSVNGRETESYPVSLGAAETRTQRGIKVVMEKGADISMQGPGYDIAHVKYAQRLTFGGEYLHAAPWNVKDINAGKNSSNGCTNLLTGDADALFSALRVGDVVTYPNATGSKMQMGQGYGLWNVPWSQYQTGGLVPTR